MVASSSSIRAFHSALKNYGLRFCVANPNFHALRFSSIASQISMASHAGVASIVETRRIWTCPPVYIGRRSSIIATIKRHGESIDTYAVPPWSEPPLLARACIRRMGRRPMSQGVFKKLGIFCLKQ